MAAIGIGMLGLGAVGGAVAQRLDDAADLLAQRAGATLRLVRVAVRDLAKERAVTLERGVLTADCGAVVGDPAVDIVVEVMGGVAPAGDHVRAALESGRAVVTANKELIARHGEELIGLAHQHGSELRFGASVGGGVPMLETLSETLRADDIVRMDGVLNGTTNFILQRMTEEGEGFDAALALAQSRGYAESDPASDVDGWDATFKLCILAHAAWDIAVDPAQVRREGLRNLQLIDVERARMLGYEVKLVASAVREGDAADLSVRPTLVAAAHPLARVSGADNGLVIHGDLVGAISIAGAGAGGPATASAVLNDVIAAARRGAPVAGPEARMRSRLRLRDGDDGETAAYLRLAVDGSDGEASDQVTQMLEDRGVHVIAVVQGGPRRSELVVLTDPAPVGVIARAVETLDSLQCVTDVASRLDVVDTP